MTTPQPWDRQIKESTQAYDAFDLYRNMGPERSCAKVGQKLGKSTTIMERWSAKWSWVARAAAWDQHLDKQAQKALEREEIAARKAMKKRHRDMGISFQGIPAVFVNNMKARIDIWKAAGADPETCPVNDLAVKDIITCWVEGSKSELRSYDEATDIHRVEETTPRPRTMRIYMPTIPDEPGEDEPIAAQPEPGSEDLPGNI